MFLCLAEPSLHRPPMHFPLWASKPPLFSLQRGGWIICRAQTEAHCLPNTHTAQADWPHLTARSMRLPFPDVQSVGGHLSTTLPTALCCGGGVNSKHQVWPFPFPCHCERPLCSAMLPSSRPEGQSQVNLPWLANNKMQLELFLMPRIQKNKIKGSNQHAQSLLRAPPRNNKRR